MGRRRTGLFLVLLVLVAAAAVPNFAGKELPGLAEIGPIPGPPAIGDCLLEPTNDQGWRILNEHPVYTKLKLGPCTGTRFGEVTAVIRTGLGVGVVRSTGSGGDVAFADPNQLVCTKAVAAYVGSASSSGSNVANQWTLAFGFGFGAASPSELQVRFGQQWLACLTFATSESMTNGDNRTVGYSGSVRNSFVTGAMPSVLGSCLATAEAIRPMVCTQLHSAELFGSISTNPAGTTAALLSANCRALVGKYTRMPDPTDAGRLTVQVIATHVIREKVFQTLGPPGDETGFATCVVSTTNAAQHLTGPLLGLATQVVPLA